MKSDTRPINMMSTSTGIMQPEINNLITFIELIGLILRDLKAKFERSGKARFAPISQMVKDPLTRPKLLQANKAGSGVAQTPSNRVFNLMFLEHMQTQLLIGVKSCFACCTFKRHCKTPKFRRTSPNRDNIGSW